MHHHTLILGGTADARRLAGLLDGHPVWRTTSSLAGRVANPRLPPGAVRVGGFGGAEGLVRWLDGHGVEALVDATHPFAAVISANAAHAAAVTGVPLLALRRPGWSSVPGDDWHPVGSLAEAARLLPSLGRRAFLTTGRLDTAAFAGLTEPWFLLRSVDAPDGPLPPRVEVLTARGPFTVEGERELMARHRIDVLVTKDSGAAETSAKLTAARELGVPVIMVSRPPAPAGVPTVPDPAGALAWLTGLRG